MYVDSAERVQRGDARSADAKRCGLLSKTVMVALVFPAERPSVRARA